MWGTPARLHGQGFEARRAAWRQRPARGARPAPTGRWVSREADSAAGREVGSSLLWGSPVISTPGSFAFPELRSLAGSSRPQVRRTGGRKCRAGMAQAPSKSPCSRALPDICTSLFCFMEGLGILRPRRVRRKTLRRISNLGICGHENKTQGF